MSENEIPLFEKRPDAGFLLVQTFAEAYEQWLRHWKDREGSAVYSVPQKGVTSHKLPKKYRGIYRSPLMSWDVRTWGSEHFPTEEPEACQALWELESVKRSVNGFLFSLSNAQLVFSSLRQPEKWEIIWARQAQAEVDRKDVGDFLGFEPTFLARLFLCIVRLYVFSVLARDGQRRGSVHGTPPQA